MSASDHSGSAAAPEAELAGQPAEGVAESGASRSGAVPASSADILPGDAPPSLDWDDPESLEAGLSIPELDEMGLEDSSSQNRDDGPDPYVGAVISDRYVVDEMIGEGGMGKVYRVHHQVIGKRLALKILHAELAKDKEAVGRFLREAKAASSIGNPHIVDVVDFGEAPDGAVYFAMEYLEGGTLGDLMEKGGALDLDLVGKVALQLCDGLAAAHRQQIVHRDLKPDNVTLVAEDAEEVFCKILDFGIAKVSTSASSTKLTMAGAVFGTPHYMSPEQAAGDTVDHRTDVYSLGVMLYEMVAGQLPFHAANFMGILTQHMYKAPPTFAELEGAPEIPRGLEAIILKCLSKKPEARYQSMEALAADLQRFAAGDAPEAVHDMMARSGGFEVPADYFQTTGAHRAVAAVPRPKRHGPKVVAAAGVLVAVGVVLFVLIKDATSVAQPTTAPTGEAVAIANPAPEPDAFVEDGDGTAGVETVEVLLHAKPEGAVAVVRGVELSLPTLVPVKGGEPITAEIKAEGHEPLTVEIDGTTKKVSVALEESPGAKPRIGPRPGPYPKRPAPKSAPAPVDGVVDPWEK